MPAERSTTSPKVRNSPLLGNKSPVKKKDPLDVILNRDVAAQSLRRRALLNFQELPTEEDKKARDAFRESLSLPEAHGASRAYARTLNRSMFDYVMLNVRKYVLNPRQPDEPYFLDPGAMRGRPPVIIVNDSVAPGCYSIRIGEHGHLYTCSTVLKESTQYEAIYLCRQATVSHNAGALCQIHYLGRYKAHVADIPLSETAQEWFSSRGKEQPVLIIMQNIGFNVGLYKEIESSQQGLVKNLSTGEYFIDRMLTEPPLSSPSKKQLQRRFM